MSRSNVVIIGGGVAGTLSAIVLAKLARDLSMNLEIQVIEKKALWSGASKCMARRHYGGEYPKDMTSAKKCLHGAMVLQQMFGEAILTPEAPMTFLVSDVQHQSSEVKLSVEEYQSHYEELAKYYEELLSKAENESKLNVEELQKMFFGASKRFFSPVDGKEVSSIYDTAPDYYKAAFATKERGFDIIRFVTIIKKLLKFYGVIVKEHTEVMAAEKNDSGGFSLLIESTKAGVKEKTKLNANYVVNASWHNAFSLEKNIDIIKEPDQQLAKVHLRAMMQVSICQQEQAQSKIAPRGVFALIGASGGMYSPFNDKYGFLYYPSDDCSYIGEAVTITSKSRSTPSKWESLISGEELDELDQRLKKGYLEQCKKFFFLKGRGISEYSILVSPTVTFDRSIEARNYENVQEIVPGWFRNIPTKGTYAGLTAIQTAQHVFRNICDVDKSCDRKKIEQKLGFSLEASTDDYPVVLTESLRFTSIAAVKAAQDEQALGMQALILGMPEKMYSVHTEYSIDDIFCWREPISVDTEEKIAALNKIFTPEEQYIIPMYEKHISLLGEIYPLLTFKYNSTGYVRLLVHTSYIYAAIGRMEDRLKIAIKANELVQELFEKSSGEENEIKTIKCIVLHALGSAYGSNRENESKEKYLGDAIKQWQDIEGFEKSIDYIATMNCHGNALSACGKFDKAEAVLQKVLVLKSNLFNISSSSNLSNVSIAWTNQSLLRCYILKLRSAQVNQQSAYPPKEADPIVKKAAHYYNEAKRFYGSPATHGATVILRLEKDKEDLNKLTHCPQIADSDNLLGRDSRLFSSWHSKKTETDDCDGSSNYRYPVN